MATVPDRRSQGAAKGVETSQTLCTFALAAGMQRQQPLSPGLAAAHHFAAPSLQAVLGGKANPTADDVKKILGSGELAFEAQSSSRLKRWFMP